MIVLFRPGHMSHKDFDLYRHCLTREATGWGEEVVVTGDGQEDQWWDRVNETAARWVLWFRPEFIPWPSLAEELDLYLDEQQLVVVLTRYSGTFHLGQGRPARWEEDGVCNSFAAFQLAGQRRWALPPAGRIDKWAWLAKTGRGHVYRLPQQFSGNADRGVCSRSVLGEVVASPWGAGSFGRFSTGERHWLNRDRQLATWRSLVEAWDRYLA